MYPKPMLDFNQRRQFCIDKLKQAYDTKMYGDNEKVMNGKWKTVFDFDDSSTMIKDEANGDIDGESKGTKRSREVEVESDDGADADEGDVTDGEPAKKAPKKGGKGKNDQKTLDSMVSRTKKK